LHFLRAGQTERRTRAGIRKLALEACCTRPIAQAAMPMSSDAKLSALRAAVGTALAEFLGADFRCPVTVRIAAADGADIRLRFSPPEGRADAGADGRASSAQTLASSGSVAPGVAPPGKKPKKTLPELDASVRRSTRARKILAAADLTWQHCVDLAVAAGEKYGPRLRHYVRALVDLGYLERQPGTKKLRKLKDFDDDD
jgi:hypothetical protein